jgi:hypothetical protein
VAGRQATDFFLSKEMEWLWKNNESDWTRLTKRQRHPDGPEAHLGHTGLGKGGTSEGTRRVQHACQRA